ncbi:helix-turn-helix domain-containing protein [Paenibacillus contaminans]
MLIRIIEEMQLCFSSYKNIDIAVIDLQGKPLMPLKENGMWRVLDEQPIEDDQECASLESIASFLGGVAKPIFFDVFPGIQAVAVPIHLNERVRSFVIAGTFIERDSLELVERYFQDSQSKFDKWEQISKKSNMIKLDEKQGILHMATVFAENVTVLVDVFNENEGIQTRTELLRQAVDYINNSEAELDHLLELFCSCNEVMEFSGYAKKIDDDTFQVLYTSDGIGSGLLNKTFSFGEGFLGLGVSSRQFCSWSKISRDPRSMFFIRQNIVPHFLFCSPVIQNHEVIGLLFGGSVSSTSIRQSWLNVSRTMALLIGIQANQQYLQDESARHLLSLTTLQEVCSVASKADNIRQLLFPMIDMSMNLMQGAFAIAVISQQCKEKMQVISRGLSNAFTERYAQELSIRYRNKAKENLTEVTVSLERFDENLFIAECLLMHGKQFYGILSIALPREEDFELYKGYLTCLAAIGGSALKRMYESMRPGDEQVTILHKCLQRWDPESYDRSVQAIDLVIEFAAACGTFCEDRLHILVMACKVADYPRSLLGEVLENSILLEITKAFDSICRLNEGEEGVEEHVTDSLYADYAQIVAVVFLYLRYQEHSVMEWKKHAKGVNDEWIERFSAFLAKRQVVEKTILVSSDLVKAAEPKTEFHQLQTNPDLPPLSHRELEVLGLLMDGLSNREIGERLVISEHTVKNHITKIFLKMEVTDRASALAKVYKSAHIERAQDNFQETMVKSSFDS